MRHQQTAHPPDWDSLPQGKATIAYPTYSITIQYIFSKPANPPPNPLILLIHGFPQTSYQYRNVIPLLTNAGYTVLAPDYRGAGSSSHPANGYDKKTMAEDLHTLVTSHLNITDPIHVVGHDIGGMIAHAYAARFPQDVRTVTWGECPLPGTRAFEQSRASPERFHFSLHRNIELATSLIAGRERVYLNHFFRKQAAHAQAITEEDVHRYVRAYEQSGALQSAFKIYDAFSQDEEDNRSWVRENGKCKVPLFMLNAELFDHVQDGRGMAQEMYEDYTLATVEGSGHYVAEEEPAQFVSLIRNFIEGNM